METVIEQSEFARTRELFGFETAVIIFQDNMPDSEMGKFTLLNWVDVFMALPDSAKLKKVARQKILSAEADIKVWKDVFERYTNYSEYVPIRAHALNKIVQLADNMTLVEYLKHLEGAQRKEAIDKILLSTSFDELRAAWERAKKGEREAIFKRMEKVESTFEQWKVFRDNSLLRFDDGKEFAGRGLLKMREKARTIKEKWEVFHEYSKGGESAKMLLKEIGDEAKDVYNLYCVYSHLSDAGFKQMIYDRLVKTTGEFSDWLFVNQTVDENDPLRKLSLGKLKAFAVDWYGWDVFFHRTANEKEKELALENMINLAQKIEEARHAYHHATTDALRHKAITKMKEFTDAR